MGIINDLSDENEHLRERIVELNAAVLDRDQRIVDLQNELAQLRRELEAGPVTGA